MKAQPMKAQNQHHATCLAGIDSSSHACSCGNRSVTKPLNPKYNTDALRAIRDEEANKEANRRLRIGWARSEAM